MNTNITENTILNTDSYKVSHYLFLNDKTRNILSYGEARAGAEYDENVFFGLRYFLEKVMTKRITLGMIDQAEEFMKVHLPTVPFNRAGWEYIVNKYDGRIPVRIRAVPEGTVVPTGNIMYSIESTDPENLPWIGAYFETALLRAVWYGTTVATRSREFRKLILEFLKETGDPDTIDFKFVDFGARGAACQEAAEIGGAAHLINFMTTDNIIGIAATMQYYGASEPTGFSIPASEHSVTCQEGEANEKEFFRRAIRTHLRNEGDMVSLVADTYDFENALDIFCNDLKQEILDSPGTVVVRPDSGDPTEMVMLALNKLYEAFGGEENDKGYIVLNPSVRVIQGDGVDLNKVEEILYRMQLAGFSADNIVFGCGGFLLQNLNRDTQRFAQKACAVKTEDRPDVWVGIRKTVKTDESKSSKAGDLTLVKRWGVKDYITIDRRDMLKTDQELMKTVYQNGFIMDPITFNRVRDNAREGE